MSTSTKMHQTRTFCKWNNSYRSVRAKKKACLASLDNTKTRTMQCLVPVLVWRMRTVKSQYNEYLVTAEISSSIWNTAALRTWRVALRTKLYQKVPPTFECNTHAIVFNYADHNHSTRSNENAHIVWCCCWSTHSSRWPQTHWIITQCTNI